MADTKPNDSLPVPAEDPHNADDHDENNKKENKKNKKNNRPVRQVVLQEHDTSKERTETVIEWAQCIMDKIEEENKNQNNTSRTKSGADENEGEDAALASHFNFNNHFKEMASQLKKQLDANFKGTWHVITGREFGSNVTCDSGSFMNFKINNIYFLVLQSGPPEREKDPNVNEENEEKHMKEMIDADQ